MHRESLRGRAYSNNMEEVSYLDLGNRPAFKLAMQVVDGRWFLYAAHMWEPGWSIVDVTDPSHPKLERFVAGPPETVTRQIQIADGIMITSLEVPRAGWWEPQSSDATAGPGVMIWDVSDPLDPRKLSTFATHGTGPHRNYYDGGRFVGLATSMPGYDSNIYVILDIQDPSNPRQHGAWWFGEQWGDRSGIITSPPGFFHGPAQVEGNRAYLAYGQAGAVILDVTDMAQPRLLSRLEMGTAYSSVLGCHTFLPIPERKLAVINTEAIAEGHDERMLYVSMVDISDELKPKPISVFPVPKAPASAPYVSFLDKGGRFGPHNQHHHQHQHHLLQDPNHVYLTYFNAGLRLFDTTDPYYPEEIAWFVPPDPASRKGPQPSAEPLVAQSEDVLVDARGYAYFTDKNMGVFCVKYTG